MYADVTISFKKIKHSFYLKYLGHSPFVKGSGYPHSLFFLPSPASAHKNELKQLLLSLMQSIKKSKGSRSFFLKTEYEHSMIF